MLFLFKVETHRIDAVMFAILPFYVLVEDMAEVTPAVLTVHLCAMHAV